MSSNPLVSVIIPVHNGEKYLKEAIDSCLSQDYSPMEIIVVDDKSEDRTLEILNEYKKNNSILKVIPIMCPGRIKKQVEYMEKNPNCVAVGGQIDIINENSDNIGHRVYAQDDAHLKRNRFLFQPFAHPAVMLRRSTLEEVGLYPENMWKTEDVKLFLTLSTKGDFANLPDTVLKYRMTFKTESQAKMVDHFKKTNEVRNWAIKNLNIRPTFRESLIWGLQKIGVRVLSIIPPTLFMKVFELSRKILS